jgi:hypothetical protein
VTSDHYAFSWYRGGFRRNRSLPPPHQLQSAQASAPMRHILLCLILGFLAAFLTPIICLLLLFLFMPEILKGDVLVWSILGPALFLVLLPITIAAGSIVFFVAMAKLPDRGWRSLHTFNILLMFTATVTAAGAIAWPYFETPPEIGPQQTGLPTLRLAWTLKESGPRSLYGGPVLLTWSTDGERLAAYGGAGIIIWSPDGKYQKEFPRPASLLHRVLRYLFGRRLLIMDPVAEVDGAFSVVDAEAGEVLQKIPGCRPGRPPGYNGASDLAVSPDERFVAVICGSAGVEVDIYSPVDWSKVATLDVRVGEKPDPLRPSGLAFSPDGRMLAVGGGRGRTTFFEVGTWTPSGSLVPFPEPPPSPRVATVGALAFSPDQAMIAIGSESGGSWWTYPPGIRLPGSGAFKEEFPADPLRIFRVSDGKRVASLGSFPGGLRASGLTWSPSGEYLPFTMQLALSASGIRFNRGFPWWLRAGAKSISAAGIFCSPRMVPSWPQISPMA